MKVLVLGSGAREHALVRGLLADPVVTDVIAAPGNPGMAVDAVCEPLADITDAAAVTALAARHTVDLVVVGPEAPLVAGVGDALRAAGYAVYGPDAAAARLEGSKAFAKEVMATASVPTALAHVCTTLTEVAAALDALGAPHVVKEDGLAAGKGVVVTDDRAVALTHAEACLSRPGGQVVVEEYLDGPEVSVFCICDGSSVRALSPAQDFKRIFDGDQGPNTGGMGAYSPLPWAPAHLADHVIEVIAQPVVDEMRRRGTPFVGTLYVGLAMTSRGPRVVEFNVRFGDPDGQVSLARLVTPLGGLLYAAATGRLEEMDDLHHRPEAAVVVVAASAGYPASSRSGDVITGVALDAEGAAGTAQGADETDGADGADGAEVAAGRRPAEVLHAGTALDAEGRLVTAGGRVLNVLAVGDDLAEARDTAYRALGDVRFAGMHYRRDIALAAARGEIHL
ncbi:MAG: phosphoribosylamine--glycine ligase [Actinomycetales bacterium]|nr:phosphoribosylamine--glycine ligase [Actinomycetales bacterium]